MPASSNFGIKQNTPEAEKLERRVHEELREIWDPAADATVAKYLTTMVAKGHDRKKIHRALKDILQEDVTVQLLDWLYKHLRLHANEYQSKEASASAKSTPKAAAGSAKSPHAFEEELRLEDLEALPLDGPDLEDDEFGDLEPEPQPEPMREGAGPSESAAACEQREPSARQQPEPTPPAGPAVEPARQFAPPPQPALAPAPDADRSAGPAGPSGRGERRQREPIPVPNFPEVPRTGQSLVAGGRARALPQALPGQARGPAGDSQAALPQGEPPADAGAPVERKRLKSSVVLDWQSWQKQKQPSDEQAGARDGEAASGPGPGAASGPGLGRAPKTVVAQAVAERRPVLERIEAPPGRKTEQSAGQQQQPKPKQKQQQQQQQHAQDGGEGQQDVGRERDGRGGRGRGRHNQDAEAEAAETRRRERDGEPAGRREHELDGDEGRRRRERGAGSRRSRSRSRSRDRSPPARRGGLAIFARSLVEAVIEKKRGSERPSSSGAQRERDRERDRERERERERGPGVGRGDAADEAPARVPVHERLERKGGDAGRKRGLAGDGDEEELVIGSPPKAPRGVHGQKAGPKSIVVPASQPAAEQPSSQHRREGPATAPPPAQGGQTAGPSGRAADGAGAKGKPEAPAAAGAAAPAAGDASAEKMQEMEQLRKQLAVLTEQVTAMTASRTQADGAPAAAPAPGRPAVAVPQPAAGVAGPSAALRARLGPGPGRGAGGAGAESAGGAGGVVPLPLGNVVIEGGSGSPPRLPAAAEQQRLQLEQDMRSVVVENVHPMANEEDVATYFRNLAGPVEKVTLLRDGFTGRPTGVATVVMGNDAATQAAAALSGSLFAGLPVVVTLKAMLLLHNMGELQGMGIGPMGPMMGPMVGMGMAPPAMGPGKPGMRPPKQQMGGGMQAGGRGAGAGAGAGGRLNPEAAPFVPTAGAGAGAVRPPAPAGPAGAPGRPAWPRPQGPGAGAWGRGGGPQMGGRGPGDAPMSRKWVRQEAAGGAAPAAAAGAAKPAPAPAAAGAPAAAKG